MSLVITLRGALAEPLVICLGDDGEIASYLVSIAGLTDNTTYGLAAQIGGELTASASGWSAAPPSSIAWQWHDGSGAISGATSAAYTPVAGDDLENIHVRATPADGSYGPGTSAAYTVRHAPPASGGGIADQDFVIDSAISPFDVAADFTGAGITYALAPSSDPLPAGLALAPGGLITGTPATEASAVIIVVRGTNSGGYADTAFSVTISAAPSIAAIEITDIGPQATTGSVPVAYTISQDATCAAVMYAASAAVPAASDFNGGGAPAYVDLGSIVLTTGGTGIALTIPDDLAGDFRLAFLPPGGGDAHVAASGAVTIKTTPPVYAASIPADAATDIAIDSPIALTFDVAVVAGSGSFTLYDVTAGGAAETFAVGGAGDNGGTIGIAGAVVTLTPGAEMANGTDYSVRWSAGAVRDAVSNDVAANTGDTLVNFSTVAASGALWDDSFEASQAAPMPSYALGNILAAKTGYSAFVAGDETDGPEVVDLGGTRAVMVTNGLGTRDRWLTLDYETYPELRKMSVTVKQITAWTGGGQDGFLWHYESGSNYVRVRWKSTGACDVLVYTPIGGAVVFESPPDMTVTPGDVVSIEHTGTNLIFRINDTVYKDYAWVDKPATFGAPRLRLAATTGESSSALSNVTVEAV